MRCAEGAFEGFEGAFEGFMSLTRLREAQEAIMTNGNGFGDAHQLVSVKESRTRLDCCMRLRTLLQNEGFGAAEAGMASILLPSTIQ
jgi:hypothetical protein